MKKENRYCGECGRALVKESVNPEQFQLCYMDYCGTPLSHTKYNTNTGNRQIVYKYTCHLWKKKLFGSSKHDSFIEETLYEEIRFGKWRKVV